MAKGECSAMPRGSVCFVSTMEGDPWGGSEELWAQAARILATQGVHVAACVRSWAPMHPRFAELADAGVAVVARPARASIPQALMRRLRRSADAWHGLPALRRMLARAAPDLVVLSEGGNFPPASLLEFLAPRHPFVTISHNNCEQWWPEDRLAARLRPALSVARRCYFVSEENRRLAMKQLGCELPNAAILRNPSKVSPHLQVPWPTVSAEQELRLACVGRLDPRAKGQDLLIEALATPSWAGRRWRLALHGSGPMRDSLERLVARTGLTDRVTFAGHTGDVRQIWANSHVLVQPSRHEGLPLTVVEAMACGRPVLATDVAGHAEVIIDGLTGFLAEAPTVSSIGDALERLWQRRSLLPRLGTNGRARIQALMPGDPAANFADAICGLMHRTESSAGAATPAGQAGTQLRSCG